MTADEAAKVLGVSCRLVYQLAAPRGPIPCIRVGRVFCTAVVKNPRIDFHS